MRGFCVASCCSFIVSKASIGVLHRLYQGYEVTALPYVPLCPIFAPAARNCLLLLTGRTLDILVAASPLVRARGPACSPTGKVRISHLLKKGGGLISRSPTRDG